MNEIMVYVHTHIPKYLYPCDWNEALSTVDVPGARKIPNGMPGVRLDEFDSFFEAAKSESKYTGVVHYRRRPLFLNQQFCEHSRVYVDPSDKNMSLLCSGKQRDAALKILESHDVIQYRPFYLPMPYRQQFKHFTPVEAWDIMMDVISQMDEGKSLGFYEVSNAHVWCTLMIAKTQVVAQYVDFIKKVINDLHARKDYLDIISKKPRVTALLMERLTPFWVFHNRLKSAYVPMVTLEQGA